MRSGTYLAQERGCLAVQQGRGGTVLVDQLLVDVVSILDLLSALKQQNVANGHSEIRSYANAASKSALFDTPLFKKIITFNVKAGMGKKD